MYKLEEFKQLVRDFSGVADFLVVYLAEAHSTGQWKWGFCGETHPEVPFTINLPRKRVCEAPGPLM